MLTQNYSIIMRNRKQQVVNIKGKHGHVIISAIFCKHNSKGMFLWENPNLDFLTKITRIMVDQRNQRIYSR